MKINLSQLFFFSFFIFFSCANSDKKSNDFEIFLSHFETLELPFEITLNDIEKVNLHPLITGETTDEIEKWKKEMSNNDTHGIMPSPLRDFVFIPEIKNPPMLSMSVPSLFLPIGKFYTSDNLVTIIYQIKRYDLRSTNRDYHLVSFDLNGNISPRKTYLGVSSGSSLKLGSSNIMITNIFRIDKERRIWQTNLKNIWKEDFTKNGVIDNEIIEYKLVGNQAFILNEVGKLIYEPNLSTTNPSPFQDI